MRETAIPTGQRWPKESKLVVTAHQWLVVPCDVAMLPCLLDCECRLFPDTERRGFCVLIIHWWWTVRRNLAVHRRWVHNNGRWVDRKNFIDTVGIPVIVMPTSVDQAIIAIQVTKLHIALFQIQFRVMVTNCILSSYEVSSGNAFSSISTPSSLSLSSTSSSLSYPAQSNSMSTMSCCHTYVSSRSSGLNFNL
jgi:hypothetical protein